MVSLTSSLCPQLLLHLQGSRLRCCCLGGLCLSQPHDGRGKSQLLQVILGDQGRFHDALIRISVEKLQFINLAVQW